MAEGDRVEITMTDEGELIYDVDLGLPPGPLSHSDALVVAAIQIAASLDDIANSLNLIREKLSGTSAEES